MNRLGALLLTFATFQATACGPTCQDACNRLYQPSECGITRPGRAADDLVRDCRAMCETALDTPGELGSYDPYEQRAASSEISLDNDRQAAEWMECVQDMACENLENGYCPPVP